MKRGAPDHPKVAELAESLKVKLPTAIGYLELLWHFTAVYAPAGDIGRYPDKRIEAALHWAGTSGRLVETLTRVGWLDQDGECRLIVHDWHEHADQGVRKRLQRAGKAFVEHTPKVTGRNPVTCGRNRSNGPDTDSLARAHTPEPVPEPIAPSDVVRLSAAFLKSVGWEGGWKFIRKASSQQIGRIYDLKEEQIEQSELLDSLYMIWARLHWFEDDFWPPYFRKADKKAARIAYFECVTTLALHDRIVEAVHAQSPGMLKRPEDRRPHAATWIHKERWDDTVEQQEADE